VENSAGNALRVFGALKRFGAPVESDDVTPETFTGNETTYRSA